MMRRSQQAHKFLRAFLTGVFALALVTPGAGFAQEGTSAAEPTPQAPPQAALIGPLPPMGRTRF